MLPMRMSSAGYPVIFVKLEVIDNPHELIIRMKFFAFLMSQISGILGQRLEDSGDDHLQKNAMICYICSGNMDKLADSWTKMKEASASSSPDALQVSVNMLAQVFNLFMYY